MSLKLRYAAFLLFLCLLLLCFCALSLYLILHGSYILAAMLFAVLYLCTYMLGKRFARIFCVLSVLRLLRKNSGTITQNELDVFLKKSLAGRRTATEIEDLKNDILTTLQGEGAVVISDETIVLSHS